MSKRINKSSLIGLFLIAVMLLSTFAFAVIQSFSPQAELPKTNIIDYRLDSQIRQALIQNGATIITFEYSDACFECQNQKFTLESFANEYKTQIFLEEIVDENLNDSRTTIASFYGSQELKASDDERIMATLCSLMVDPPAQCALLK